jgi:hypothetical protein
MEAFREYFKANQAWLAKGTRRAGMDTRHWLSEIRHFAIMRRQEIQVWRRAIEKEKAQKQLQKAQEQAEKDAI